MSEESEQMALFNWAAHSLKQYPQLALLFSIPNGGHRHISVARRLKASGVKPGVPDIFLPVARPKNPSQTLQDGAGSTKGGGGRVWYGLWIELKVGRNRPSRLQDAWIGALRHEGYRVEVCYGWLAAAAALKDYLGG